MSMRITPYGKHSVVSRKPLKQQEQQKIYGLDSERPTEGSYGKSFPSICPHQYVYISRFINECHGIGCIVGNHQSLLQILASLKINRNVPLLSRPWMSTCVDIPTGGFGLWWRLVDGLFRTGCSFMYSYRSNINILDAHGAKPLIFLGDAIS